MADLKNIEISVDSLPVHWTVTHKKFGLSVFLFSVLVPAAMLIFMADGGKEILLFIGGLSLLMFLPLVVWGLNLIVTRESYTLTGTDLALSAKSLFGSRAWTKKLSSLTLMNTVTYSRKTVASSRSVSGRKEVGPRICNYSVMLVHGKPGSDHEATLFRTEDKKMAQSYLDKASDAVPVKTDKRLFDYNLSRPVDGD